MSEADSLRCTVDSESEVKTLSVQSLQLACHWSCEPAIIGDGNQGNLVRSGGLSNLPVACAEEPLAVDLWPPKESPSPDSDQTHFDPGSEEISAPVDGADPQHISATTSITEDYDADILKLSSLDLIKDLNNVKESDGQKIANE